MIEALVIITVVFSVVLFVIWLNFNCDIDRLEGDLESFKIETTYKLLLPQIKEFGQFQGFNSHFLNYGNVFFHNEGSSYSPLSVKLSEIESKLADMKKAVEISCPKKCAKKKRNV